MLEIGFKGKEHVCNRDLTVPYLSAVVVDTPRALAGAMDARYFA